MKRNRIEKVLRETWPNGIPACDYSRAVGMVLSAGMALALEWDWNSTEGTSRAPPKPRSLYASPAWKERVRNAMSGAGPLTQAQIAERAMVHRTVMTRTLRALGAVRVGEVPRANGFGTPSGLYVLPDGPPGATT